MDLESIGLVVLALVCLGLAVALWYERMAQPERIRKAVQKVRQQGGRVRVGTTVEHFVPFLEEFPYDPSDVRFVSGGPVDYVVFAGLTEGEVTNIVFVDVKTGHSGLNKVQKQVRRCAIEGRVEFGEFRLDPTGRARMKQPRRGIGPALDIVDEDARKGFGQRR